MKGETEDLSLSDRFARAFESEEMKTAMKDVVDAMFPKRHVFNLQHGDWIRFVYPGWIGCGLVVHLEGQPLQIYLLTATWTNVSAYLRSMNAKVGSLWTPTEPLNVEEIIFAQ